ncbi:MAG: response regulator transcription factor [Chloroflexi bacterium]|nr:response regulator transcription factor [Chloroflexota bacterium]MCY3581531.1 response regulator transcription factor [Chloroflexota bacterium]MCY3716577.1 response regulator transcription factor [Chloroflexota bacterium]MDE2651686.1 response regulator transcription factor [Chloroflexota bacterium]MXV93681.1 response regulator transcription factor [Chloroflexota bacterium]
MAKKILLVEDEEKLVANLADKLRAEGYEVITALDGESGWRLARGDSYDLIVLDIMLPGLDGLSLCRMIRNDSKAAGVPIIMLTARGTEVDKIVGLESGADDYIVKPFSLGEFLARVRVQMRRPATNRSLARKQLAAGDLRLDITSRRFFRADMEVKLSNKEFDLLTVFMRNPNAVLSRDLILTKVWGHDYFPMDKRTVDVHIRWLREKIEADPSKPTRITTVRGVGYRFEG